MQTIRKTDSGIQTFIAIISMAIFILSQEELLLLCGEFLLGAWQLGSALINTYFFIRSPFKKQIIIYWVLTGLSLSIVMSYENIDWGISHSLSEKIFTGALIGSWVVAIYYWYYYRKLTRYLEAHKNSQL